MEAIIEAEQRLVEELARFKRLAVAFSGGVDSTLLLFMAVKTLGHNNVIALFADSVFQSDTTRAEINRTVATQFGKHLQFITINLAPLAQKQIYANDEKRCYHCKKLIYQTMLEKIKERGVSHLADGTNCSDLSMDRPGIKAIRELHVVTPYVDAGLHKEDIRSLAACYRLPQADLPANSCLAARTEKGVPLTVTTLEQIAQAELFLADLGFVNVRVKPREQQVYIELGESDFSRLNQPLIRKRIITYFQRDKKSAVFVNLIPRA